MTPESKFWKKLFLFSLGLSIGAAFCMKWIETDFLLDGNKFTMVGLELFYSKEKVQTIIAGIDDHTRAVVRYQLYFDFALMAGIYPLIGSTCMMAMNKANGSWIRRILALFSVLQVMAWWCDVRENLFLLRWIDLREVNGSFAAYHATVINKWVIAIMGVLISLPWVFRRKKVAE